MNNKSPLHGLKSKKQLLEMLEISKDRLFKSNIQDNVKIYIAKDPKERLIEAPEYIVKKAQNKIKNCLMKCDIPSYVFSGVKNKSYIDNASMHIDCKYLYKTDISAFFPNIPRNRVYKFFVNELCTSPDVAKALTDICTVDISDKISSDVEVAAFVKKKKIRMHNHLCTGSPASPLLSYLVNRDMFDELNSIAVNNGMVFSVYVDDVFFSSDRPIAMGVREQILKTLTKYGYNISFKKVIYYNDKKNKKITGVVVTPSNELNVPNKLKRKLVKGFSKGSYAVKEESVKGMLIAARLIEKNAFSGINNYVNKKDNNH